MHEQKAQLKQTRTRKNTRRGRWEIFMLVCFVFGARNCCAREISTFGMQGEVCKREQCARARAYAIKSNGIVVDVVVIKKTIKIDMTPGVLRSLRPASCI